MRTTARTIQWQDYGQFTLWIIEGELFNELGMALAHPLHFWLGQLAIKACQPRRRTRSLWSAHWPGP